MHKSAIEERTEEILEQVWVLREDGVDERAALLAAARRHGETDPEEVISHIEARGLLVPGTASLALTVLGEEAARSIVRRHRLAERLLSDVLEVDPATIAADACRFEHVLSPGVTTSICTLLGHPPTCPHGRPIPRGECCGTYRTELKPLVIRLLDLGVGERAVVTFVEGRIDGIGRLGTLGLVPGVSVRLVQRRPSHVVEVGETTIAIDDSLARAIYVKRQ